MNVVQQIRTEDPRSLLERLRRRQLEAILAGEGIPAPKDIPATAARQIIKQQGVRVDKYIDQFGNFLWPKRPESVDVEAMSRQDLMSYCAKRKIPYTMRDSKADLVAKVRDGNAA